MQTSQHFKTTRRKLPTTDHRTSTLEVLFWQPAEGELEARNPQPCRPANKRLTTHICPLRKDAETKYADLRSIRGQVIIMMPAVGVSPSGDDTDTLPPSSDANSVVSNSSSGRGSEDGQASWPSLKARQRTTAGAAVVATSSSPSSISADRHDNSQLDQDRLDRSNPGAAGMMDPHLEPVDRVLLLVADGQELSRRVLGNERQCARLGDRLSALKNPLWQLQARVRTQAVRPPDFIDMLSEEVSHCLDVLLELTHPDWWNQICRKVRWS